MRLLVVLGSVAVLGCTHRQASAATEELSNAPVAGAVATNAKNDLPVDLSALHQDEKASFAKLIQKYPSACGKAHSLEVSLKTDPVCRRSVFGARYLARLLALHQFLDSEIEEHYEARFNQAPRAKIDVEAAPMRGESQAPCVLVEFSDFQCPHCKHLQPALERALADYRGRVRLYFKNYPISQFHPQAQLAAQAALAAGKQGKFWQYHDALFGGDQEHEASSDLERVAKELKLDVKKWRADLDLQRAQVERDHAQGERLEISATPTLFINGRRYRGPVTYDEIKDWIDEELNP